MLEAHIHEQHSATHDAAIVALLLTLYKQVLSLAVCGCSLQSTARLGIVLNAVGRKPEVAM
uniref:SFRICE_032981 n=1 Tax=Spodoptera frugiperda TaxID=7108 RepID=A0A2H1WII1_SPOFR